jgi:hypothetical protein
MNKGIYDTMQEHLKGFSIVSTIIRSSDCIYILFENNRELDDEEAQILFRAGFFYSSTVRKWGYKEFINFYKARACVLPSPDNNLVCVDFKGNVITQTGITSNTGFNIEEKIPLIRQVSVMNVREIGGKAFIAGNLRTVFRREGPNNWVCLFGNDLALRDEKQRLNRSFGFYDIGGFSLNDIYACGDDGDVCHYDGTKWMVINVPTNKDLLAIHCCASNGKVYMGGRDGLLIEGRADEWQIIGKNTPGFSTDGSQEQAGMGATIKDMVWYKDRLYMATDQGLYEYIDGGIQRTLGLNVLIPNPNEEELSEPLLNERVQELLVLAGADENVVSLASLPEPKTEGILGPAALHSLSTDGELLVLGGADKVAVYDGETWRILYAPYGIDAGGAL